MSDIYWVSKTEDCPFLQVIDVKRDDYATMEEFIKACNPFQKIKCYGSCKEDIVKFLVKWEEITEVTTEVFWHVGWGRGDVDFVCLDHPTLSEVKNYVETKSQTAS